MKNDLVELCDKTARQELKPIELEVLEETACTIVTVSGGYPESYEKGMVIHGLDEVAVHVFHAGTALLGSDIVTNGGRVLAVTALDADPKTAMKNALEGAGKVKYNGIYYRTDIGLDLLELDG
jgi:phosphoribosylamine--glycine ligase